MTTTAELIDRASGRVRSWSVAEVEAHLFDSDTILVDVRERSEVDDLGHIARAVHVPRGLLEFAADPTSPSHLPDLDPRCRAVVYCEDGQRSVLAADTLRELGWLDVGHLAGGFDAWRAANGPVAGLKPWHRPASRERVEVGA